MSTLVTGAAGFLGSHVVETLLRRGDTVVGIDNVNDYYPVHLKRNNLELLKELGNFTFIEGDITDLPLLEDSFRKFKPTRIAHIAARAGVRPSIADPLLYSDTNITGTLNLLELSKQGDIESFVLTSSSSVYGNSTAIPFKEEDSATDKPISQYAATKKATELLAYTYFHLYGLPINIIRPFTLYGPRGRPDMAPWLFLKAALTGGVIKQFGDGSTRRDYTFIGDFVPGFVAALDRPMGYEIFNLGNSETVSLKEMLQVVSEVTGKELNIELLPMQPGDVECTNADISKARAKLGYNPQTPLKEGMAIFHDWFVSEGHHNL
ncbi:MAG: GDP-mannose 4,6-dehydratase [Bdellovibrionales bacterium]|nr:GDP-mannose 4,6-dehydratase [Bdellovibrionales bacterium]